MEAAIARLRGYKQLYYNLTGIKVLESLILLLLALSNSVASNTIVKTLPGFVGDLPFLLETGYIGVGEVEDEIQLFYYFIESKERPEADPLVLWITGGPGCSALSALIYEIGPLCFDYESSMERSKPVLVLNHYSWTKVANIILVDAPVGTGFSYATTSEGYNTSDTKSTADIYMFLKKWLVAHPKFEKNPIYISGDSYSGKYVPVIVNKISDGNKAGNLPLINLKGYVLGNPFTDAKYDYNSRVKFAHRIGLLSDKLFEKTKLDCEGEYVNPNKSDAHCIEDLERVNMCLKDIRKSMVLEPHCSLTAKSNKVNWGPSHRDLSEADVNPTGRWCREDNYVFIKTWANDKQVQEALHVRIGTIQEWNRCNKSLSISYDYSKTSSLSYVFDVTSSIDYHRNLTSENLRAIIYSGDHDLLIPYVGTFEWIQSLNLTVNSDGEWRPWFVDGQIAGYTEMYLKNKYSLTFATVKGGGHTAPEFKPKECLNMISRWFAYCLL